MSLPSSSRCPISPRSCARPAHLPAARAAVVLEITEGVFMAPGVVAARNLEQIRRLGVRIALDDFGTGYSALSYLKRFPVDVIKADRSFLDGLGADRRDLAVAARDPRHRRRDGHPGHRRGHRDPASARAAAAVGLSRTARASCSAPPAPAEEIAVARRPGRAGGRRRARRRAALDSPYRPWTDHPFAGTRRRARARGCAGFRSSSSSRSPRSGCWPVTTCCA